MERTIATICAGLLACANPGEDPVDPSGISGASGSSASGGTGVASEDTGGSAEGSADAGSGVNFDVPDPPAGDSADGPVGCEKVDVLLAVDNSSSMSEEIEELQGPVFDSFPDHLLSINGGLLDFHLGVIDACNDPAALHNWGDGGDCGFPDGVNYMLSSDPELEAQYACVTELSREGFDGTEDACSGSNDDEQPANTAADAATDVAGTNAGFMRDDAVLVVVAITDEDEQPIPEQTPEEIADKLIAAKGSIENVVFLGIGGDSECEGPYGSADEAEVLRDVTQIFADADRGLWWDLCDGQLEEAFAAAVDVVDTACSEFTPEG